jgi:hypothetical protein
MAIVDYWDNPLSVSPVQVIGYRGELEEFPHDIYSFLLTTIREADLKDVGLIWRWLQPMQQHWESQYASILSIMQLQSAEQCPVEFLDYLRKDTGIMDDLGYIWGVMDEAEKRRFIKFFVRFLRFRNTSFGITEMIPTMLGQPIYILNYFDYRWICSGEVLLSEAETALGREDDGYDPWLISESNMPVGLIPDSIVVSGSGSSLRYGFNINDLVANTENLPVPTFVFVKFLGTNVTVRLNVITISGVYLAYTEDGEDFLQPASSISTEPSNFRVSWEPDDLVSDIIMEDDGTVNRDLVEGLARFSRPSSERMYIRYYNLIELFDDADHWTTDLGTATYGTNLVTLSHVAEDTRIRLTKDGAEDYSDYSVVVKMKCGVIDLYGRIRFMRNASDDYYFFEMTPTTPISPVGAVVFGTWRIVRMVTGVPTVLDTGTFDWLDLDVDYVWRIDCFLSPRVGGDVQIIQVYQDENLLTEVVDDPAPWSSNVKGTVEIVAETAGSITASRVTIHPLPMEYTYVGP